MSTETLRPDTTTRETGTARGFAVFETEIGACGIAWGRSGIIGVHLPEREASETRRRLSGRFPDAHELPPPPDVQRAMDGITALLRGEPVDLTSITLEMEHVPPFNRRVYEVARTIPPGSTLTYGEIATRLGDRLLARDVGQALGRNPFSIVVPCHRVVAAGGKTGGFSARGGVKTKLRMLAIEGAPAAGTLPLFDEDA